MVEVSIRYSTNEGQSAANWLTPEQTMGKRLPYMFTQCSYAHCRSVSPMQDSPSMKSQYQARITSPKDIQVRMSGNLTSSEVVGDLRVSTFESTLPIASYLLAIVAGDLATQKIGE